MGTGTRTCPCTCTRLHTLCVYMCACKCTCTHVKRGHSHVRPHGCEQPRGHTCVLHAHGYVGTGLHLYTRMLGTQVTRPHRGIHVSITYKTPSLNFRETGCFKVRCPMRPPLVVTAPRPGLCSLGSRTGLDRGAGGCGERVAVPHAEGGQGAEEAGAGGAAGSPGWVQ